MFILLALLNDVFKTLLESLKKDLGEEGFQAAFIIAALSWAGLFIALFLFATGRFEMPTDPTFYLSWIAMALLTEVSFALFLMGLLNTSFFAANSLENIGFVFTAIYAAVILNERYGAAQIAAIVVATIGSLLFFKRSTEIGSSTSNKGSLLVLLSLLSAPLEYVFYKLASLHTSSYHQFLTGRIVMDFAVYTACFFIVSIFLKKRGSGAGIKRFICSFRGAGFIIGTTGTELLESWLIYKIPISLFTILGALSIPAAYFIGRKRYGEPFDSRHIIGGILIAAGITLFVY